MPVVNKLQKKQCVDQGLKDDDKHVIHFINGFFKSISGVKFVVEFPMDGIKHKFTGNFSPSVQLFKSFDITLIYEDANELTSTRNFSGQIGTSTIKITLDNGPVIDGQLNMPVSHASTVSGTGVWTEN